MESRRSTDLHRRFTDLTAADNLMRDSTVFDYFVRRHPASTTVTGQEMLVALAGSSAQFSVVANRDQVPLLSGGGPSCEPSAGSNALTYSSKRGFHASE